MKKTQGQTAAPAAPGRGSPRPPVKQKKKSGISAVTVIKTLLVLIILGLGVLVVLKFYKNQSDLINRIITIEAGSSIDSSMCLKENPIVPALCNSNLDFASVDTRTPQTIRYNISMYGMNYPCELIIKDTIAPTGKGVPQKLFSVEQIPDALSCVTDIEDVTGVSAIWENEPDISKGGKVNGTVKISDTSGNSTLVDVIFDVTVDSEAPVIEGAVNLSSYVGDPVEYRKGVSVTDDYDKNPKFEIDTSGVNLAKAGEYEVIYRASDFSGNSSESRIKIKLKDKPANYVEPEVLRKSAQEVLDKIITPDMTDMEKALQITWWCRYNIRFILKTKSNSWTEAAYNAFKYRSGNCFSTASAMRALLDCAGIENMFVTRYPYHVAKHYWNYVKIDGQWYHCDATWRQGYESYFFMYTTKELLSFMDDGWNGFEFKQSKYPESATKSVQDRIDYKKHKIK